MGIDFSYAEARWSYTGFDYFRTRLAAEIGITLDDMKGFGGSLSWEKITDSIVLLLNQSDIDGRLSSEECAAVAPRLRELISKWEYDGDKHNALLLAEGMEACASANEVFEFW